MPDLTNTTLKGYEIRTLIGAGGFSAVYRAFQPGVGREVAIKIILPDYASQPEFIRRFESEAQLVARLEHPHIVPLFDYWRDPAGAYLVMRYLRGGSLKQMIDTHEGAVPLEHATRIVEQIASALALAHRHGIVHRDLKPDNVLLDEDGNAYLSDFGIALLEDQPQSSGTVEGTLVYMSPEQLRGQAPSVQSDIYSFGILLYQLLTGNLPFAGSTVSEIITQHLTGSLPDAHRRRRDLPPALTQILQRATHKTAAHRYQSALDVADEFRRVVIGEIAPAATFILAEVVNPYKGLRAFEEADAADFFGREALVQQLLMRLSAASFLAVVGPSGSGKSSVIFAGLLQSLRRGGLPGSADWYYVEMVPGDDPLTRLETALLSVAAEPPADLLGRLRGEPYGLVWAINEILADHASQLVLVIDQFEELFTLLPNETVRRQFLEMLATAVVAPNSRLKLVIALRADFMDRPLHYARFGDLIRQHSEFVLPLTLAELERAIVRPAARVGLHVEPDLLAAIIADVKNEAGALPLLQYALTEVFNRREGVTLSLAAYQATGGVPGALAHQAEAVYAALEPAQQVAARQVWLRLVSLGESGDTTRRRVPLAELLALAGEAPVQAVLSAFDSARLLTFDHDPTSRAPSVEVAHEALMRHWARLRDWLEASRADLRLQRWLATAAADWQRAGSPADYLLSGTRLTQYQTWAAQTDLALTPVERHFLAASTQRHEREAVAEAERQARELALERRVRHRMQWVIVILLFATILGAVLALALYQQGQTAQRERNEARQARATSEANAALAREQQATAEHRARELRSRALVDAAGRANQDHDGDLALRLALEANAEADAPAQAQQALYDLAYAPGTRYRFTTDGAPAFAVAVTPDGRYAVAAGGRQTMFSPAAPHPIILYDLQTGQEVRRFEDPAGPTDSIIDCAISPDGRWLATTSYDRSVILWEVATGALVRRLPGHQDMATTAAFSHDGRYLLTGSGDFIQATLFNRPASDSRIIVWEVASGEPVREFSAHRNGVVGLAISPDDSRVLSGSPGGDLLLWELETGTIVHRFAGLEGWPTGAAFSPDGRYLASAAGVPALTGDNPAEHDYEVVIWDAQTLAEVQRLVGFGDFVIALQFSPDSQHLLVGNADFTVQEWDVATGERQQVLGGHTGLAFDAAYTPDGRMALSASHDGTVRVWNLRNGLEVQHLAAHAGPVFGVAYLLDGRAVSGGADGQVILWDLNTGAEIRRFAGPQGRVFGVATSPDGTWLAAGGEDSIVRVWEVATGVLRYELTGHEGPVWQVGFNADGTRLLTGSTNAGEANLTTSLRVWDMATGRALQVYAGLQNSIYAAQQTPNRRYLAVGLSVAFLDLGESRAEIWNYSGGQVVWSWLSLKPGTVTVALTADSSQVAVGEEGGVVRIFALNSGQELRRFASARDYIAHLAFTADGQRLVATTGDGMIWLWELASGRELRRLTLGGGAINDFALSADGRLIVFGADDGGVRLWHLHPPDELRAWIAANRYVRDFSCEERVRYRVEPLCPAGEGEQ